jgi:transcription termination factor Rho
MSTMIESVAAPRPADSRPPEENPPAPVSGILDVGDKNAFVRVTGYLPGPGDTYLSAAQVARYGLRPGDHVEGAARSPRPGDRREKFRNLVRLDTVNGRPANNPNNTGKRPEFADLTPLYPQERLRLETGRDDLTGRITDLIAPIGKGQRGLIVAPPKAGKTMVLKALAKAVRVADPECHLMVVLVDERPEEVTDMRRSVDAEVVHSTFDRPASDHVAVAELAIERAKRLVELGRDVVVILDSITRLGRAYNLGAPSNSRILAGGVATSAIHPPRRFLGAARNIEDGGSLTILASVLVETGSRMDEVFFEEFKGTGNMELRLRRDLADRRIFPAVDIAPSGTRRDDLLMSPAELEAVNRLRQVLTALGPQEALELLIGKLRDTSSNAEFLTQILREAAR